MNLVLSRSLFLKVSQTSDGNWSLAHTPKRPSGWNKQWTRRQITMDGRMTYVWLAGTEWVESAYVEWYSDSQSPTTDHTFTHFILTTFSFSFFLTFTFHYVLWTFLVPSASCFHFVLSLLVIFQFVPTVSQSLFFLFFLLLLFLLILICISASILFSQVFAHFQAGVPAGQSKISGPIFY